MRSLHLPALVPVSLVFTVSLLVAPPARGFRPEPDSQVFEIQLPEYAAELAPTHARAESAMEAAATELGGQWRVYRWDRAADTPAWIYGSGYRLAGPGTDDAGLEAAARAFIHAHPAIFKARNEDLELDSIVRGAGKVAIHFAQTYEGLPVIGGRVHLAMGESGRLFAFGSEFHSAIDLEPVPALSADAAVETAKRAVPFNPAVDQVMGSPELVVVAVERFEGGATYRLAWRVRVTTEEPIGIWLTHVDARTGDIFWRENEVAFMYEGTSKGDVEIPGYCAGSTPNTPFRNMRVIVDGAGPAITDSTGYFTVAGSAGTTTATAEFSGTRINVDNADGPDASFSGPIQENVPLDILWTDDNSHPAERECFYYVNETNAYLQRIDDTFAIPGPLFSGFVNETVGECNAYYAYPVNEIHFYKESVACANTGRIGDVIAHEYGHGVQYALYGAQGNGGEGLGEGNSDITGTLMIDDYVLGRGFRYNCSLGLDCPGSHCRNCLNSLRYPGDVIGHEIHDAGRVICGFNWDVWQELEATLGAEDGKTKTAELWRFALKLFHPETQPDQVLAYFMVDDDDENLLNGTPHFDEICVGATNHGFDCPETVPVYITHTPLEDTQDTQNPYEVVAEILALEGSLNPDSLVVEYRLNFGGMQALLMTPTGNPDEFSASIPAQPVGTLVQYYIRATNDMGGRFTHPREAPGILNTFFVGTLNAAVDEDMESDPGWTVGPNTATRGIWERADPFGIIKFVTGVPFQLQPEDDHTPDPGVQCYFTGPGPGFPGDNSVSNGGYTTLQSAVYDLSGEPYVRVTFALWYSNHLGTVTDDDMNIDVSTNGGATWVTLDLRSENTHESWEMVRFELLDHVPATSAMKFRFVARDFDEPSLVEVGVDDFLIQTLPGAQAVESPAAGAPATYAVEQNRPNPFNPSTEISYSVPSEGRLTLRVYDVDGRLVRTLVDGVVLAGVHTAEWDGRDRTGAPAASGIYYYRVEAPGFTATRPMVLVK